MTITQRALKFAEPVAKSATTKILLSHAYYQGATDQMQLDIDKACEWLKENEYEIVTMDITYVIRMFRKAMEE